MRSILWWNSECVRQILSHFVAYNHIECFNCLNQRFCWLQYNYFYRYWINTISRCLHCIFAFSLWIPLTVFENKACSFACCQLPFYTFSGIFRSNHQDISKLRVKIFDLAYIHGDCGIWIFAFVDCNASNRLMHIHLETAIYTISTSWEVVAKMESYHIWTNWSEHIVCNSEIGARIHEIPSDGIRHSSNSISFFAHKLHLAQQLKGFAHINVDTAICRYTFHWVESYVVRLWWFRSSEIAIISTS